MESFYDQDPSEVQRLLGLAVEESFLESCGESKYRFVHDNIQEAVVGLNPEDEVKALHFQVGEILWNKLDAEDLESSSFVVVNLLNNCVSLPTLVTSETSIKIAEMNLMAAEKAVSMSAFGSATTYSSKGIKLLPQDRWESHCNLTSKIYSIGAEAECSIGNAETADRLCHEILAVANLSLFDKLRSYNVLINSLANREFPQEAKNICLTVLEELNCRFPKLMLLLGAIVSFKKTHKLFLPAENKSNLPVMTDIAKIESMKLLDKLCTYMPT
mmetsp:Transcript_17842/g.27039  ORF Transcript_17842/g.27039 Transcript_17842/m.27039 type:complete len:272 (+) Transcript_17842:36-851(+)